MLFSTFNIDSIILFSTGMLAFLTAIWKVSRAEYHITTKIIDVERDAELERMKLRQEITESKLYIADTYTRNDSFENVMKNLDARLIRLETKLDKVLTFGEEREKK